MAITTPPLGRYLEREAQEIREGAREKAQPLSGWAAEQHQELPNRGRGVKAKVEGFQKTDTTLQKAAFLKGAYNSAPGEKHGGGVTERHQQNLQSKKLFGATPSHNIGALPFDKVRIRVIVLSIGFIC